MPNGYAVLSDIHLGAPEATGGVCRFTPEHKPAMETVLRSLETDSQIGRVVFAGDILDDWVCPPELPPPSFQQILAANPWFFQALERVRNAGKRITLLEGNHDAGLLTAHRAELADRGLEVLASFSEGPLLAEHGNRYTIFNGFPPPDPNFRYPPGVFVCRLAECRRAGGTERFMNGIFKEVVMEVTKDAHISHGRLGLRYISFFRRESPTRGWFEDIVSVPTNRFIFKTLFGKIMNETEQVVCHDGRTFNRNQIVEYCTEYSRLKGWTPVKIVEDLIEDRHLKDDAQKLMAESTGPKIVIFGHTHQPEIEGLHGKVYVNSGTWCDKKFWFPAPGTWVKVLPSGAGWRVSLQSVSPSGVQKEIGAQMVS